MILSENDDNARGGNFWKLTFNKGKSQTNFKYEKKTLYYLDSNKAH